MCSVCGDSQIGLRVISEASRNWVQNSCAHSRTLSTRYNMCWRLALSHRQAHTVRAQHSFQIEINFVTVAQNLHFFHAIEPLLVVNACCELLCTFDFVCGHAFKRNPKNARTQFDRVEHDNSERCQSPTPTTTAAAPPNSEQRQQHAFDKLLWSIGAKMNVVPM